MYDKIRTSPEATIVQLQIVLILFKYLHQLSMIMSNYYISLTGFVVPKITTLSFSYLHLTQRITRAFYAIKLSLITKMLSIKINSK